MSTHVLSSARAAVLTLGVQMGCIPSKQKVLEGNAHAGFKPKKERKQRHKRLDSPVIGEDAAPWVKAPARVLTEKDGCIIITERAS